MRTDGGRLPGGRSSLRAAAAAAWRAAAGEALGDAAEHLLEEANRTAPIEEAVLIGSGSTDRDGLEASVFYDTPYAARQHEETGWRHDSGRRAKWLELSMQERVDAVRQHIASSMKAAL